MNAWVGAGPRLLDTAGEVVASASFPGLAFQPVAEPVVSGSRLFWIGAHHWEEGFDVFGSQHLFGLDLTDPASPELLEP